MGTFNKVVTAQYFLWYFSSLPLILPSFNFSKKDIFLGGLLWGFAQGSWLLPAYLLEFKGNNTFLLCKCWNSSKNHQETQRGFVSDRGTMQCTEIRLICLVFNTCNMFCDIT